MPRGKLLRTSVALEMPVTTLGITVTRDPDVALHGLRSRKTATRKALPETREMPQFHDGSAIETGTLDIVPSSFTVRGLGGRVHDAGGCQMISAASTLRRVQLRASANIRKPGSATLCLMWICLSAANILVMASLATIFLPRHLVHTAAALKLPWLSVVRRHVLYCRDLCPGSMPICRGLVLTVSNSIQSPLLLSPDSGMSGLPVAGYATMRKFRMRLNEMCPRAWSIAELVVEAGC